MYKKQNFQGYYTNYSLRATTCTLALAKWVPEKLVKERIRHRNAKSLHEHQRVAQRNETLCPMLSNFLRNRFWRKIGVRLRMRKLFSMVVAWILHLAPRLHLLTEKLYST